MVHRLSLSVEWLAICTLDYVGARLLPKLKRYGQRRAVMPTHVHKSLMSGSFVDHDISRHQGKSKQIDCIRKEKKYK